MSKMLSDAFTMLAHVGKTALDPEAIKCTRELVTCLLQSENCAIDLERTDIPPYWQLETRDAALSPDELNA